MAHVGIVSAAYWGDVMPFVPIADELAARGHRVSMVVPEGFHEVLAGHDVELVHLGTDFSPRELADHGDVMERANSIRGMRAAVDLWVRDLSIAPAERIVGVLESVAPDLWISHNTVVWLVELQARRAGTPIVAGHLFPMMIPSDHQSPPMLPLPPLPAFNRSGWRLARAMTGRMMYDTEVNRLRAAHGLEAARSNVGFSWERADRILALTSSHYWPVPPDWPDHLEVTGFTIWGSADDPLPQDLADYLSSGEPPVVMTLGTSAAANARDAFTLGAEAIAAAGQRPLLLVGNERNRAALAGREGVWTFASLPAVLPHCRAVVHAAGHGTTAAALHAGVPQVLLPQGFDQVVHASRLVDLGVGHQVAWKRRSVPRLRQAVEDALHAQTTAAAAAIAERLQGENGQARAADVVEELLGARAG